MLLSGEVHARMETFHVHNKIKYLVDETKLFWGVGVGVRERCKDGKGERNMGFYHFFVSVPRTFVDYCNSPR